MSGVTHKFESVAVRLDLALKARTAASAPRAFACRCGARVYFGNSRCLACNTPLGYEPERGAVVPMQATGADDAWRVPREPAAADLIYRRCANFAGPAACDWLLPRDDSPGAETLCRACRLNRTIPNLADPDNALWWGRIEVAKRRLVSSLIALGLPLASRVTEDPERGLAFDLLRPSPGQPVVIGHREGIITLDIEEADDARREARREALAEPYRTVLGHLRHEVGHYYWQRLVEGSAWHAPFRALFGDECADYAAALAHHYDKGPAPDWALDHVSAYAALHPWEDWAETWAHYLHMVDTLDTALSFGLGIETAGAGVAPFTAHALADSGDAAFLSFVNAWMELTGVLNELSRSMGQPDFYPFMLPEPAVAKLHFVHRVVRGASN